MAMSGFHHWCVICEGKSEVTYLALLSRFIRDHLTGADCGVPPLSFSGKPPIHGAGGGSYKKVNKAFRDERQSNRHANFKIWVDADLYLREKSEAPDTFAKRSLVGKGYFAFSALVFEDFLAMHFDDDLYADWKQTFAAKRHFQEPLVEDDYLPVFQPFWQRAVGNPAAKYKKGDLPEDWISSGSLANLFRHCEDPVLVSPVLTLAPNPTFAEFLRTEISSAFPDFFGTK